MPRSSMCFYVLLACTVFVGTRAHAQGQARYRLTVENTWSEATHPGAFPFDAHFSWIGGGTHDDSVSFWDVGVPASPGIQEMAESGATFLLEQELALAVAQGGAGSVLAWHHWFCPPDTTNGQCGSMQVEFDVTSDHPLVTLVTMLGPSPDWFVGVSGLELHDGNAWVDEVVVDLRPFDGGTRDNNLFQLWGPLTTPPDPVSEITAASGQLIGPGSLGSFTFTRVGQIVDLGQGLAGDHAPVLSAEGSLLTGELMTLTASDLPPGRAAWLFLGTGELNAPLLGGVLVPVPFLTAVLPTGAGTLILSDAMPPGVPSGTGIVVQVWTPDAGGPAGASASNALKLLVP